MTKFTCTCGITEMTTSPRSGNDHCPFCRTRPSPPLDVTIEYPWTNYRDGEPFTFMTSDTGHRYIEGQWDPEEYGRCMDCDGRPHSHVRYEGDYDYESVVRRGLESFMNKPNRPIRLSDAERLGRLTGQDPHGIVEMFEERYDFIDY